MAGFKDTFDHYKKNRVVWAALLLLLLLGVEYFVDDGKVIRLLTESESELQVVAHILTTTNDVRQKPSEEETWFMGEPNAEIIKGDAVYTGLQSSAVVEMMSGGQIAMGEETLIIFDDVDGVIIPDVTRGNVRLQVNGEMRIAISGELTQVSGLDSQLAVRVDEKMGSKIEVLKGQLKMMKAGKESDLKVGSTLNLAPISKSRRKLAEPEREKPTTLASLKTLRNKLLPAEPVKPAPKVAATPIPAPEQPKVEPPPTPTPAPVQAVAPTPTPTPVPTPVPAKPKVASRNQTFVKIAKLPDLYERSGPKGLRRRSLPRKINLNVPIALENVNDREPVFVEVSKDPQFTAHSEDAARTLSSTTPAGAPAPAEATVRKVKTQGAPVIVDSWAPGLNHVRVSKDNKEWSEPTAVDIQVETLPGAKPEIQSQRRNYEIVERDVEVKLKLADAGNPKVMGYVLEGSKSPDFKAEKTKSVWTTQSRVDIPVVKPGTYFFRTRSVASNGDISKASTPVAVNVFKRTTPAAPILQSKEDVEITVGDDYNLKWKGDALAAKYDLAVIGENGKLLKSGRMGKDFIKMRPKKPGSYQFVVRSVSKNGVQSAPTKARLVVQPKPLRQVAAVEDKEPVEKLQTRQKQDIRAVEEKFRPYFIALEGASAAVLSSQQVETGIDPAAIGMLGVVGGMRNEQFWASLGVRTKILSVNRPGQDVNSFRVEGKYTKWWKSSWSPFRGPLRLGLATALESRRNQNNGSYSNGFEMAKVGLGVWINFMNAWNTGGEILYGRWIDGNQMYEISGFLGYDFTSALAFGIGYRLNLFEAGTEASSPIGLPYREASGEAFSNLRYSF